MTAEGFAIDPTRPARFAANPAGSQITVILACSGVDVRLDFDTKHLHRIALDALREAVAAEGLEIARGLREGR